MAGRTRGEPAGASAEVLVRLHDTTTGLAIAVGLLKGSGASAAAGSEIAPIRAVLDDSIAKLRDLSASVSGRGRPRLPRASLKDLLAAEALRLSLNLDLKLTGDERWLSPQQMALLELVGREALRNVRRHAGTKGCRINLNVASCPFEMRVRDWGSGLESGSQPGHGLSLLNQLAEESGCRLSISSQPGLGAELVVIGPACPHNSPIGRRGHARLALGSEDGEKTAEDAEQAALNGQARWPKGRLVRQMKAKGRRSKEAS
jgi:anti-sigma regulatory factor (Ser/Thr protein kinase)